MPWTPKDAVHKTKKASTPAKKKQWAAVANAVLKKTGDDAGAIKSANVAVKKTAKKPKEKPTMLAKATFR